MAGVRRPELTYTTASGAFIVIYHVALLLGLPFYFYYSAPGWGLVLASVALLFLTEIGITGAYHRFYAHRSYDLSRPAELVLLFLGTTAFQGSVLQWAYEHRKHHAFVDTDDDPYSIKKGFWYAHVLWLFEETSGIEDRWVSDLLKNRWLVFQHRWYATLAVASNTLVFLAVGWLFKDYLGAFVLAWWTRLMVSHHLTWFINSLAHFWGEQTFSREHSAVDNFIIAFLTVGEGYHNYHHTFASDYRNGVRWYHFDPAKWMVWGLSKIGLATNLKRYDKITIAKRLLSEDRKFLLDRLATEAHSRRRAFEQRIEAANASMRQKLNRIQELMEERRRLKTARASKDMLRSLKREIRRLKLSLKRDWQTWRDLCGQICRLEPSPA